MAKKKDTVGDFNYGFNVVRPKPLSVKPPKKRKGKKWSPSRARQFRASFGS